jgi:hypothetical protein
MRFGISQTLTDLAHILKALDTITTLIGMEASNAMTILKLSMEALGKLSQPTSLITTTSSTSSIPPHLQTTSIPLYLQYHHNFDPTTTSIPPQLQSHHNFNTTTSSIPPQPQYHHNFNPTTTSIPPQLQSHHNFNTTTSSIPPQPQYHHKPSSTTTSIPPQPQPQARKQAERIKPHTSDPVTSPSAQEHRRLHESARPGSRTNDTFKRCVRLRLRSSFDSLQRRLHCEKHFVDLFMKSHQNRQRLGATFGG